jgi:hypothetical protein
VTGGECCDSSARAAGGALASVAAGGASGGQPLRQTITAFAHVSVCRPLSRFMQWSKSAWHASRHGGGGSARFAAARAAGDAHASRQRTNAPGQSPVPLPRRQRMHDW